MHPVGTVATFREFPGIVFPPALQALGFKDEAWHNDACARAQRGTLVVWCDYDEPKERELQGARYELQRETGDGDFDTVLLSTESLDELVAFLKTHCPACDGFGRGETCCPPVP